MCKEILSQQLNKKYNRKTKKERFLRVPTKSKGYVLNMYKRITNGNRSTPHFNQFNKILKVID